MANPSLLARRGLLRTVQDTFPPFRRVGEMMAGLQTHPILARREGRCGAGPRCQIGAAIVGAVRRDRAGDRSSTVAPCPRVLEEAVALSPDGVKCDVPHTHAQGSREAPPLPDSPTLREIPAQSPSGPGYRGMPCPASRGLIRGRRFRFLRSCFRPLGRDTLLICASAHRACRRQSSGTQLPEPSPEFSPRRHEGGHDGAPRAGR